MARNQTGNEELNQKLDALLKKQTEFSKEIEALRLEIGRVQSHESFTTEQRETALHPERKPVVEKFESEEIQHKKFAFTAWQSPNIKADIEKYIGENLINKIGIAILVIGVAIGAKYAIDHQLISPLTRIILGYLTALGLLGFAINLKEKYENFSAVLLGGAIAILYFITYAAYTFYSMFPQMAAFSLMVFFTAFAVASAISYNKQVIAHIGLVGAYAVPFLLSDGSGNVTVLFSYTAIINIGILAITFIKYWKPLYFTSFIFTWLIYCTWYLLQFRAEEHTGTALIFLFLFFGIFYLIFLGYKLQKNRIFEKADVLLLITNAFILYGLGYSILYRHETGEQLLGLFTLLNAVLHFIVGTYIYRLKHADRSLFYLVIGLVLVFLTMAIPVQLDGSQVTLLWAGEAALLFWIGRTKGVPFYEKISYPIILLAFLSMVQDWSTVYHSYIPVDPDSRITVIFNIHLLSSLLFTAAIGTITALQYNKKYSAAYEHRQGIASLLSVSVAVILVFSLYNAFRLEIANYWFQLYIDSALTVDSEDLTRSYYNTDLLNFQSIWILNYTLFFTTAAAFVNTKMIRSPGLGKVILIFMILFVAVFLFQGLSTLSNLRTSYLNQYLSEFYQIGITHITIRYISYAFLAVAIYSCHSYIKQALSETKYRHLFEILMHFAILWVASAEVIHWMEISGSSQPNRLGLSILWVVYAMLLIAYGIWKKKKHLRMGAIVLLGITLLKVFFHDIAHLDTIAKTILLVLIGILLLVTSFLYNKYKHLIADER